MTSKQALAFYRPFGVVLGSVRPASTWKSAHGRRIAHAIGILRYISRNDLNTCTRPEAWRIISTSTLALPVAVSDVE